MQNQRATALHATKWSGYTGNNYSQIKMRDHGSLELALETKKKSRAL